MRSYLVHQYCFGRFRLFFIGFLIFMLSPGLTSAQEATVIIDEKGIMRWTENDEEITGFGINYTVPFAHAYRSAQKMGIDVFKAIDQEVYHFSRLGFDLYRVHVWDTEISDTLGNLLVNEHLKTFDYLLAKLTEKNIKYIITPIAFWGNGWPEKDKKTPGFSHKYGKADCLTDPEAIQAQENFLFQFMNHINTISGIAYKNDPNLIAVEISNEPHHRGEAEEVKAYIQKMIMSVKKSGFKNPVFYNFSHGINYVPQYIEAGAQGATFQWYPTGLGYQREIPGNFLPNVDNYAIPFDSVMKENEIARIVYEFDGADIDKSYIYPAMARSFRTAGIQLATHFSYDPTFLSPFNTEYNTHYMNLAYTPHKALALMISAQIFRDVALYETFGDYPLNLQFKDFMIDPHKDMSVYNSLEKYIYTNNTEIAPGHPSKLSLIAGHGNSPLVQYDGTGAYFLDKIKEGQWRLEVMPDVLVTHNPFGKNSLKRKLASVQWNKRIMKVKLDELGENFSIIGVNKGNKYFSKASGPAFSIEPGTYILSHENANEDLDVNSTFKGNKLTDFNAPPSNVDKTILIHETASSYVVESEQDIYVKVISPDSIQSIDLLLRNGFHTRRFAMKKEQGFTYSATIPAKFMKHGMLEYFVIINTDKQTISYPGEIAGAPFEWDFDGSNPYRVPVIAKDNKFILFEAQKDWPLLRYRNWPDQIELLPVDNTRSYLSLKLNQIHKADGEHPDGMVINDYTIRYFLDNTHRPPAKLLKNYEFLIFELANPYPENTLIQIAIVDNLGKAFGKIINVGKLITQVRIKLNELEHVPTVIMPRAYPTFLPYYFKHSMEHSFDPKKIEGIQISLKSKNAEFITNADHGISIGSMWME